MKKSIFCIISVLYIFILTACSCDNESVIGSSDCETGLNSDDPKSILENENNSFELFYVFAVNGQDEIVSVRIYDSVMERDFILSIEHAEKMENNEIVEVTEPEQVSRILSTAFDNSFSGEEGVVMIGMISTEIDILEDTSWGCIKCLGLPPSDPCHQACDKNKGTGLVPIEDSDLFYEGY
ncbi:MAG: hypothetical protein E4H16_04350 [Candidatus Atribacteria bacterium]|nr:MAG: hypothetical protein E4H16_04350 [Candidatus Atribacteria bacterium]